jgi:hypothetical protein
MTQDMLSPHAIFLAYVLLMVLLSAFFLRLACGLCQMTLPTWRRSIVSVLLVSFLAYLTFDFVAYVIVRSMEDFIIRLPPWYSYGMWFREPFFLKWHVLSQAGPVRFVPFIPAVVVAAVLQVIVFEAQINFAFGALIVFLQWTATIIAGYVVSLLFGVALSAVGWTPQQALVSRVPERPRGGAVRRSKSAESSPKTAKDSKGPDQAGANPSEEPASLQVIEGRSEDAVAPREFLEKARDRLKAYADSHLAELEKDLGPLTKHLPEPVRTFLDGGGWWVVLGVAGLIALLWLRSLVRKLTRPQKRSKHRKRKMVRKKTSGPKLKEDLAWIGSGYAEEGAQRLTIKRLPARLRLVILSLGTRHTGELTEDMADRVLDWMKPGLAAVVSHEPPAVRVWPPFYSAEGFATALATNVPIREPKGMKSHWVLVGGQVRMGRTIIHVGLAVYTEQASSLRMLRVKGERWMDVFDVEAVGESAGAR